MRRSAKVTAAAASVAGLATATVVTVLAVSAGPSAASMSIADASSLVRNAVVARQRVSVPPDQSAQSRTHPAATALSETATAGQRQLSSMFIGSALASANTELARAITQEKQPDFVVLDGGASNFVVTKAQGMRDHSVQIQAKADTWSLLGQIQNGKIVPARPQNTILITARVVKTPQGLRISDFSWKFAPGSAP
jgi:hypothetical protein